MKTPLLLHGRLFFCISSCLLLLLQIIIISAGGFSSNSVVAAQAQAQAQCLSHQKKLLLQLRSSLVFNSTASTKLARWNHSTDDNCCVWPGVECDTSGHVISLILDNETITDGIHNSSALFSLQYLETLNLAFNYFDYIPIPVQIYNLTNLTYLNLSFTEFGGQIPNGISRLTRLVTLDLSNNRNLKLENPNLKQFFENSTQLRQLYLDWVDLSGTVVVPKFLANFSNLKTLSLSGCNLHGAFPTEIFQIQGLQELSLAYVDFSYNHLTGSIPNFLPSKNLTSIDSSFNGLTGPLSSKHFEGLSKIVYINLRSNYISGRIPPSLFSLPSLQRLDLSYNSFDGVVDEYVNVSASQLERLYLSSNCLNGSFPKYFFEFPKLSELLLYSNSLSGRIQSSLFSLPSLQRLDLSNNSFDGLVDEYVNVSASQLEILYLSSNCLNESFPKYFFEFSKMSELLLDSNSLGGRIIQLESLQKLTNLGKLDLSNNGIRGEIPSWIWELGNGTIMHLNLSCNFLDGLEEPYTIPSSLYVLDLHSNQLRGPLLIAPAPTDGSIYYVDYSNNFFNGSIPFGLGSFAKYAHFLSLSNNSFTGTIPESICNASSLEILDLSNNKLSGILPSCLFDSSSESLAILNLGQNQIHGNIPDSFAINCALRTLDLSRNSFEGKIPKSLINCSSLEVLNVGSNKMVDTFPCSLKNLSSLRVLVWRSNNFHGDLHCVNANHMWPNLQIIDIAFNNFSGNISPKFLNWKGMTVDENIVQRQSVQYILYSFGFNDLYYQDRLTVTWKGIEMKMVKILEVFTSIDFSCNNFYGVIPDSIGFLTSLYALNLSHNALTGNIPETIGNLKMIESLDLSANQLGGQIPTKLAKLTFLSVLNLSFNRLCGMIPTGNQLNTFEPDSYLGNQELCGFPLPKSCKSPTTLSGSQPEIELGGGQSEIKWEYVTSALGFAAGLGVYLWMLLHNKRCREAYEGLDDVFVRLFGPRQRGRKCRENRVRRNRI